MRRPIWAAHSRPPRFGPPAEYYGVSPSYIYLAFCFAVVKFSIIGIYSLYQMGSSFADGRATPSPTDAVGSGSPWRAFWDTSPYRTIYAAWRHGSIRKILLR